MQIELIVVKMTTKMNPDDFYVPMNVYPTPQSDQNYPFVMPRYLHKILAAVLKSER